MVIEQCRGSKRDVQAILGQTFKLLAARWQTDNTHTQRTVARVCSKGSGCSKPWAATGNI